VILLDGRKVRDEIAMTLQRKIEACLSKPELAIVQIGDRKESASYIQQKKIFGERIGVVVRHRILPVSVSDNEVTEEIRKLNADNSISGIIIQLPLPDSLNRQRLLDVITPMKDVDGLGSENVSARGRSVPYLWPATARGIMELLDFYGIAVQGKKIAVLGRSDLVGKPTAEILRSRGALVSVCHSETHDTASITRESDIIVVAIGKPHFIGASYTRDDKTQVVVDVGITAVKDGGAVRLEEEIPRKRILGDVDFEAVKDRVAAISPVPGGVGPMTVAALFENLMLAYEWQRKV